MFCSWEIVIHAHTNTHKHKYIDIFFLVCKLNGSILGTGNSWMSANTFLIRFASLKTRNTVLTTIDKILEFCRLNNRKGKYQIKSIRLASQFVRYAKGRATVTSPRIRSLCSEGRTETTQVAVYVYNTVRRTSRHTRIRTGTRTVFHEHPPPTTTSRRSQPIPVSGTCTAVPHVPHPTDQSARCRLTIPRPSTMVTEVYRKFFDLLTKSKTHVPGAFQSLSRTFRSLFTLVAFNNQIRTRAVYGVFVLRTANTGGRTQKYIVVGMYERQSSY